MEENIKADLIFKPCTALTIGKNFLDGYVMEKSEISDFIKLSANRRAGDSIFFVGNLYMEFPEKLWKIRRLIFGRKEKIEEFDDVSSEFGCIIGKKESYLVDYNNTSVLFDYTHFLENSTMNFLLEFTLCSGKTGSLNFQFEKILPGNYEILSEIIKVKFTIIDQSVQNVFRRFLFFPTKD